MPRESLSFSFRYSKSKDVTEVLHWILDFVTNWDDEWSHTNSGRNFQRKVQDLGTYSNQSPDKHSKPYNFTLTIFMINVFPDR